MADIYLSNRSDGKPGSGTLTDPFDASTPARYDALLARYASNTVFYYAPGVYPTAGWDFQRPANAGPGCVHRGAGLDRTIVRLTGAPGDGVICGSYASTDGFEFHDMTLDVNANAQPGWAVGACLGAVNVQGSDVLIRGCKIVGFGTSKVGHECFAVFCWPGRSDFSGATFRNVQVRDCVFTEPATGNRDGLSACVLGADEGISLSGVTIAGCSFLNLSGDFIYSHAFSAHLCFDNFVNGCATGFYLEPDQMLGDFWVLDNAFTNVQIAAQVSLHPTGRIGHLEFSSNQVFLTEPGYSSALNVNSSSGAGQPVPSVGSVRMRNNQVTGMAVEVHKRVAKGSAPVPAYRALDLRCTPANLRIQTVTVERNRLGSALANGYEFDVSANPEVLPNLRFELNVHADGMPATLKRE